MQRFEKLTVYKQALELVDMIYKVSRKFPKEETYNITSQLRRAAISIPLNIAEGQGRGSKKNNKQFLLVARGSAYELIALYEICSRRGYLKKDLKEMIYKTTIEIISMLNGLITYMER